MAETLPRWTERTGRQDETAIRSRAPVAARAAHRLPEHASYGAERYDEKRHGPRDAKGELDPWCLSAEHPRRET
jgi:hypothetical protein